MIVFAKIYDNYVINSGGVFIVIFVGIILACLTLVVEYWWTKRKNRTEDISDQDVSESINMKKPRFAAKLMAK